MSDRTDCFSWSGVTFGIASLVMFGFARREGKKAKQLQQAHPLPSISGRRPDLRYATEGDVCVDDSGW